jgi:hypothetical protein
MHFSSPKALTLPPWALKGLGMDQLSYRAPLWQPSVQDKATSPIGAGPRCLVALGRSPTMKRLTSCSLVEFVEWGHAARNDLASGYRTRSAPSIDKRNALTLLFGLAYHGGTGQFGVSCSSMGSSEPKLGGEWPISYQRSGRRSELDKICVVRSVAAEETLQSQTRNRAKGGPSNRWHTIGRDRRSRESFG